MRIPLKIFYRVKKMLLLDTLVVYEKLFPFKSFRPKLELFRHENLI